MSFCVDLWNGFDIIKTKFITTHKQIKSFSKLLNSYVTIESAHCRNLDNLYKECKEYDEYINANSKDNLEYPLEQSLLKIIKMIDTESSLRKEFIVYINKNIIGRISQYLAEPKISLDQRFLESREITESFNKSVAKLVGKQEAFYSQCKEVSSYVSQLVLDKNYEKKNDNKRMKLMNRLLKLRDEYVMSLNETNIERRKYNFKMEKLLNELERTYTTTIERLKDYLSDFCKRHHQFLEDIYQKQKSDYEQYHSKIDLNQEKFIFIRNNATKEFPLIKFEFCPFKEKSLKNFLKSKYRDNKKIDKEFKEMIKVIQQLFKENEVFSENVIQTGISKYSTKKDLESFYARKYTKTKYNILEERAMLPYEDKREITPAEREEIIFQNIKYIKTFINESITKGKVKIFEEKIMKNETMCKLEDVKDIKLSDDTNKNVAELISLVSKDNYSSYIYIETVIKVLSFLRSKGFYEINKYIFKIFNAIFLKILDDNPDDDYILKNVIILAQTFYYIDEDKRKIYLQDELKRSDVFKNIEVWHRCINYTLNLSVNEKDLTIPPNREEIKDKLKKEALSVLVHYLCNIQVFANDKFVFEQVKDFYLGIYQLDEKEVVNNVEEYMKFINKEQLKNVIKDINNNEGETKKEVNIKGKKEEKGETKEKDKKKDENDKKLNEKDKKKDEKDIKRDDNDKKKEKMENNETKGKIGKNEKKEEINKKEKNQDNETKGKNDKNEKKEETNKKEKNQNNEIKGKNDKNEKKEEINKKEKKEEKKETKTNNDLKTINNNNKNEVNNNNKK